MGMVARRSFNDRRRIRQDRLGLISIKRRTAFSAKIVIGPELD
jgi:hypothetical protein